MLGESEGAGVARHVAHAQRLGLPDQRAQHAPAARQLADLHAGLGRHAARNERFQLAACGVEDAQRGVLGADYQAGRIDDLLQHAVQLVLGSDPDGGLGQPLDPLPDLVVFRPGGVRHTWNKLRGAGLRWKGSGAAPAAALSHPAAWR